MNTPLGGGDAGGGLGGGRAISTEEAEHVWSVNCDTTNSGTMWRGNAEVGVSGINVFVGTGGVGPGGGVGGCDAGGGNRRGGRIWGRGLAGN